MEHGKKNNILALILCGLITLSLFACEGEEDETNMPTEGVTAETPADTATSEQETTEESTTETNTVTETETNTESNTETITETVSETESETTPIPCDGDHSAMFDAKTHWRDACEEHGINAITPKAHQFNSDSGTYMCKVCRYIPECGGIHDKLVYLDTSKHYIGPCEFCTFEGNPEEYSKHNFEGKDYICIDCGFDPECNGLHGKDNGDGTHIVYACDLCGARASDGAVPHKNDQCDDTVCDVCGSKDAPLGPHTCEENDLHVYKCIICNIVPACNGIHSYEKDEKGHKGVTCEYCGLSGTVTKSHTIAEKTESFMDSTIYKYACTTCGYITSSKEIPASINKYIAPVLLVCEGYMTQVSSITDENGSYYHVVKAASNSTNGGQHIWLREQYNHPDGSGSLAGGGSHLSENFDIGNAQYMVIKVRTNSLEEPINLKISTTGWNYQDTTSTGVDSISTTISFKPKEINTWTTFVLDLRALGNRYAEDENGGYIIDTFCLYQGGIFVTPESYIDIGYVAFVDNINEAKTICDTPTFVSIASDKSETVMDAIPTPCDGDHSAKYDTTGHWIDPCDEHGIAATSKSSHQFDTVGGVYKCTGCDYTPECGGAHTKYVYLDETKHCLAPCEFCTFEGDTQISEDHKLEDSVIDGVICGKTCAACGYSASSKELPDSINKYIEGSALVSGGHLTTVSKVTDATGSYYHVVKEANSSINGGQHVWLREQYKHPDGSGTLAGGNGKLSENFDIGNAKYMVIRVRTNSLVEPITINISTTGWNYQQAEGEDPTANNLASISTSVRLAPRESGVWTTFVVDLALLGNRYAEDANGGYIIDTFMLNQGSIFTTSESYIDIGYVAFVDDIDEAKSICDTKTFINIAADKSETVMNAN